MKATYPAFLTLGALYQEFVAESKQFDTSVHEVSTTEFKNTKTGRTSHRLVAPIVVAFQNVRGMCTRNEWWVLGEIMEEMREYNALWAYNQDSYRKNSKYREAIKGLIDKKLLLLTPTTGIYIVNPRYIRRGDPYTVTATTANMVINRNPTREMITDKRPIHKFTFIPQEELRLGFPDMPPTQY